MSFPSPTTASTVGEPTLRGQLNVHQNLVYWRMEEADPSKRFRNNMQLMLLGGDVARLEKDGREPISLHVDWMDDNTLRIDWTPANKNWGSSVVRLGHVSGVPGLIEDAAKFWKLADWLPAGGEEVSTSGRGTRSQVCLTVSEAVLASGLLPCRKCRTPACEFRAPQGYDHCCRNCKTRAHAETHDGHDVACSRLKMSVLATARWQYLALESGSTVDAACLIVPPVREKFATGASPAGAILFLTGAGHVDDHEDFLVGGVDLLLRNDEALQGCHILAPKPNSGCGLLRGKDGERLHWNEKACWALLVEVIRALGPEEVDVRKLYVTGFSLGAAAAWHLGIMYGDFLAAMAPVSGRSQWRGGTWPVHEEMPRADVRQNLEHLPIRAYQISKDKRAGTPFLDMQHMSRGRTETSSCRTLPGMTRGYEVNITEWQWYREDVGATWEYWEAAGPLYDWPRWAQGDNHCIWYRCYPQSAWNLVEWMKSHTFHPELRWDTAGVTPKEHEHVPEATRTLHEDFLARATRAREWRCMTSSVFDVGLSSDEAEVRQTMPPRNGDVGVSSAGTLVSQTMPPQECDVQVMPDPSADQTSVATSDIRAVGPKEFSSSEAAGAKFPEPSANQPARVKACPGCGQVLDWTNHAEGRYTKGWACDNYRSCGMWQYAHELSPPGWWRFHCHRCLSDFCTVCAVHLKCN